MRLGLDSYSYHRRFGEVRAGESAAPGVPWPLQPGPVLAHARGLAVDVVMLETCYLPEPESLDAEVLGPEPPSVAFSWGHPWPQGAFHGLEGGASAAAEAELARWIDTAARFAHRVMRITLGSPQTRVDEPSANRLERLLDPLKRAADQAGERDLALAIENHGDLTAAELVELIELVGRPNLGVTLDNVNLIRLGDDMVEGTRLLAPLALVVQLKDHLPTDDPGMPGGPVCTALGEGGAPLEAVLERLREARYDGAVCVEIASLGPGPVDELAMVERSVAWLRSRL